MSFLKVKEIIEKYAPLYPEDKDWGMTVDYLYTEESEYMEELSESIEKYGMRDPILLPSDDDVEDSDDSFVLNGTHRIAYAIKNNIEEVPVRWDYVESSDDDSYVETVIVFDRVLSDEDDDLLFESLRAFKLNEEVWVNIDLMSSIDNKWSLLLPKSEESLASLITSRIKEIVGKVLPEYEFTISYSVVEEV